MLRVSGAHVYYGSAHVLHGLTLSVQPKQIVCMVGRNGAGKSTTLKAVMGLVRVSGGEIWLDEKRIDGKPAHDIARLGLAYVPEDRGIFGSLSVEENVRVAVRSGSRAAGRTVQDAIAFFPDLLSRKAQRASSLSGGQQQMLAVARALAVRPRLMMLDEPTKGLAPSLVQSIREAIVGGRSQGLSILLVEQNLELALAVGDYFFVISRGTVAYEGTREELLARPDVIAEHLGVGRVKEVTRWQK